MRKMLPGKKIGDVLKKRKVTFATAESCTGGLISSLITDVPGCSEYFKGSIVAYSNSVKETVLGVKPAIIKKYGAVSSETAVLMAKGARRVLGTDIAVSITGIAGPSGGTKGKPVGLAYIAFSSAKKQNVRKVVFKGNRRALKRKFAQAALVFVYANLHRH